MDNKTYHTPFPIAANSTILKYLLYSGTFKNGLLDGFTLFFSSTGAVTSKGMYKDGFREGDWTEKLSGCILRGEYVKGFKQGIWHVFSSQGIYTSRLIYQKGVLTEVDEQDEDYPKSIQEHIANTLKFVQYHHENPNLFSYAGCVF